ncbi:hypothetical protein ACS0TY_030968 [Phlomoides rotata]
MMAFVVQDVASIPNAESYAYNCISALSKIHFIWEGEPFPVEHPKELPPSEGLVSDEIIYLDSLQSQALSYRAGDLYNACRLIKAPYLEVLERDEEPKSVIYVSFGTTVSVTDEHVKELAHGLEQSKVKFLWVLRDADKGDVFDGQVRRNELPEGFEERVEGVGMVSITLGVPIAAWPMHSDQPVNTAFVTDVLKTGLVEWKQRMDVVKASTIENVVRRLMASEEGDVIRKRAEEVGTVVRQATHPGGASRLELDSFIDHITR